MNFRKNIGRSALLGGLLAIGLAGCGGSDNDSDEPATTPVAAKTYPVESVLQALLTTSNTSLSSIYVDPANREDYVFATEVTAAGQDVQFGGKNDMMVKVAYLTTTLSRNGVKVWEQPGKATLFYTLSPFQWHGQVDDEGTYSVHDPVNTLPATATVGTRANWFTSVDYTDRNRTAVKQRSTVDYYLAAADSSDTAWLCLDFKVKDEVTSVTQSSATCLKTDSKGAVLQVKREGNIAL